MTDATLPVTQSLVEEFTEQYLESLGSPIEKQGNVWNVTVPEEANTSLLTGTVTLVNGDTTEISEGEEALHPESSFFQKVLDEADDRTLLAVLRSTPTASK